MNHIEKKRSFQVWNTIRIDVEDFENSPASDKLHSGIRQLVYDIVFSIENIMEDETWWN